MSGNRCRLCGTRSLRLKAIGTEIASQINFLFRLHISLTNGDDKLSKSVCRNCLSSLGSCWTFYEQVQRVQDELFFNETVLLSDDDDPLSLNNDDVRLKKDVNCKKRAIVKKRGKGMKVKYKTGNNCTIDDCSANLVEDPRESWPDYPWGCNICGNNFADEQYFRRHPCFSTHNRYFCADCPKAFKFYNKIVSHIKAQHWNRLRVHLLLQCDVCKRWFRSKDAQEFHREQEHPEADRRLEPEMPLHMAKQSFDCRQCGKSFANKRYLKQHEPVHSAEKQFICDICGQGFRQAPGLDYHTKKYHTEADQQYHCDQCGKMFPVKKNLEVHMITHASERPFACDICQKTFKTQFSVDLHRTRHADTRKYICKICRKTYKILRDLQVHTKTHTSDRTHKCTFCEKAFKMKSHLISHERQHTGEQPYSCLVCQRKFTSVGNRLKHMRRIHKICLREVKDNYDCKEEQMTEKIANVLLKGESSSCKLQNSLHN